MSAILLSAHVIVAMLAVGPIAVVASMFPRYAHDVGSVANVLYRICRPLSDRVAEKLRAHGENWYRTPVNDDASS
jgi:ABC-type phosphate/phosphonate transport system permease subunit